MYEVLPLKWTQAYKTPTRRRLEAETVFGTVTIMCSRQDSPDSEWQYEWSYCFQEYHDEGSSVGVGVADCKRQVEAFYLSRLLPALAKKGGVPRAN